ncbi:hypothetical protein CIRG_01169 [Coccidioides immitis RMSCC 2394]|uniref:Uncharacterized protein n=1 Tax=Coccidioides immitis RMSCC 2394 TaxID=404692 RepID=A0A0J6Y234_COCIT|nr:hypothetical protein CIRG_01169 [Coccidioides immitis RMSCC 2394]
MAHSATHHALCQPFHASSPGTRTCCSPGNPAAVTADWLSFNQTSAASHFSQPLFWCFQPIQQLYWLQEPTRQDPLASALLWRGNRCRAGSTELSPSHTWNLSASWLWQSFAVELLPRKVLFQEPSEKGPCRTPQAKSTFAMLPFHKGNVRRRVTQVAPKT